jgi:galactose mutarotase-like enzyme
VSDSREMNVATTASTAGAAESNQPGVISTGRRGPFEGVILENDQLRVEVLPALGAKVVSLRDRTSGREWLTQADPASLRLPEPDEDWSAYDCSGWDECFPNILAGTHYAPPWAGTPLPDHGEVWSRSWAREATNEGTLRTSIDGVRYPYTYARTLSLHGARLRAAYAVTNRGDTPFPCMWALHPLFAIEPGMHVEVPGVRSAIYDHGTGPSLGTTGSEVRWPTAIDRATGAQVTFTPVPGRDARLSAKLFAPTNTGTAALVAAEGRLVLRWDVSIAPYVGLWLDYGGYPEGSDAWYHLAIEPSTGAADDLAVAARLGPILTVAAGAELQWRVEFSVGANAVPVALPHG